MYDWSLLDNQSNQLCAQSLITLPLALAKVYKVHKSSTLYISSHFGQTTITTTCTFREFNLCHLPATHNIHCPPATFVNDIVCVLMLEAARCCSNIIKTHQVSFINIYLYMCACADQFYIY